MDGQGCARGTRACIGSIPADHVDYQQRSWVILNTKCSLMIYDAPDKEAMRAV